LARGDRANDVDELRETALVCKELGHGHEDKYADQPEHVCSVISGARL
jgi:hypothetical protein